jgi:hypothetical protein
MFGSVAVAGKFNNTFSARNAQRYVRADSRHPEYGTTARRGSVAANLAEITGLQTNYRLSLAFLAAVRQSKRFSEIMHS